MKRLSTTLLIATMTTCIGCDQLTKDLARDKLQDGASVTILENVAKLVYAENAGIAFGIGSDLSGGVRFWLFIVGITGALLIMAVVAYRRRNQGPVYLAGFTLLLAGGISNLLDRIVNDGYVVDFMLLRLGSFRTIVFNVADVLVLTGAVLLVWSAFRSTRRGRETDATDLEPASG